MFLFFSFKINGLENDDRHQVVIRSSLKSIIIQKKAGVSPRAAIVALEFLS